MRANFMPGISVELHVNGQPLPEYNDEEATEGKHRTVTRYVEVVPNTDFSVHLRIESNFRYRVDDILTGINIDGQKIANYCSYAKSHLDVKHETYSAVVTNINGVGQKQVFTFGALKTTDESLEKSEGSKLKNILSKLGEVTVWLRRCKILESKAPEEHRPIAPLIIGDSVPEKALKGRSISTRAALKEAGTCPARGSAVVDHLGGRHSFAKFTFKYRSQRDLQIEGIIPRSPSPAPLDELDLDSMTREQAIEVLRQQREQQASSARVKRERAPNLVIYDDGSDEENGEEEGISITSVEPVKKRQRISTDSGVDMIDLTDD